MDQNKTLLMLKILIGFIIVLYVIAFIKGSSISILEIIMLVVFFFFLMKTKIYKNKEKV